MKWSVKQFFTLFIALLIMAALYFASIGRVGYFEPDEGRYSDMSQNMVLTGNWMVPHMNYVTHFHKPPLFMWQVAASMKTFGLNEWAARFPNTLYGLASLVLVCLLGNFLFNFKTGIKAFFILGTCGLFFATARLVTTDASLTFWIMLAMFSLAKLFFEETPKIRFYYLLAFALGCAFLTKGPVAFLAPALTAITFMIARRKALPNPGWHILLVITLFAAIALPWYLWACAKYPGLLDYFLHKQIGARVASKSIHFKKFYYFIPVFLAGCFVWTSFLPAIIQTTFSSKQTSSSDREKLLFLFLWFVPAFLVFSVFPSKLPFYIVPLLASFALTAAFYWNAWEAGISKMNTRTFSLSIGIWFLSHVALLVGAYYFTHIKTQYIAGIPPIFFTIGVVIIVANIFIGILLWISRRYKTFFWLQLIVMMSISAFVTQALPYVTFEQSKIIIQRILAERKNHEKVILYRAGMRALPTYLKERVIEIQNAREVGFDDPKDLEGYIFENNEELFKLLKGPERVFVVTFVSSWNELQNVPDLKLYPLALHRRWVLFSNQK